jgi:hypothetical protein
MERLGEGEQGGKGGGFKRKVRCPKFSLGFFVVALNFFVLKLPPLYLCVL